MTEGTGELGRRAAHKHATRAALRRAAWQLFAAQGYAATTVRQIADAAHVTERTFYRYFDGKEGLLAEEAFGWIEALHRAIVGRPSMEQPFEAVRRAMVATAADVAAESSGQFWGALEGLRPLRSFQPGPPRRLRRIEESVIEAVAARRNESASDAEADAGADFPSQVLGRIAVAALRSAVIRHRQLQSGGETSPGIEHLLDAAFTEIAMMGLDHAGGSSRRAPGDLQA
jgi:AcrR family transcriptional regulator